MVTAMTDLAVAISARCNRDRYRARPGAVTKVRCSIGLVAAAGAELMLGPGALAGQLDFCFSDLNHRMTGNVSAGGLALLVGYHLSF